MTSLVSYLRCWSCGIPSSMWLHLIYFLRFIVLIPQFIVIIDLAKVCLYFLNCSTISRFQPNFVSFALFGLEAISVFFLIILFCFVDKFDGSYENFSSQKVSSPEVYVCHLESSFSPSIRIELDPPSREQSSPKRDI